MNSFVIAIILSHLIFGLMGCSSPTSLSRDKIWLSNESKYLHSTSIGNLITNAVRNQSGVDIVLYPTALLVDNSQSVFYLPSKATEKKVNPKQQNLQHHMIRSFPDGDEDFMMTGTMKGSHIKQFILERSQEVFGVELQTAGLEYEIRFAGGVNILYAMTLTDGQELLADKYYRVAINKAFYFSRTSLPGYRFRNGFNFNFTKINQPVISIKKAVTKYLAALTSIPLLDKKRAVVRKIVRGTKGALRISQIQGPGFSSPYFGFKVQTQGIVTALGTGAYYPKGLRLIIQSASTDMDNDPRTSEGLALYFDNQNLAVGQNEIRLGDKIKLSGVVYEEPKGGGLGLTSLREIDQLAIMLPADSQPATTINTNKTTTSRPNNGESTINTKTIVATTTVMTNKSWSLPPPIILGALGLKIPTGMPSHYQGQLVSKRLLNLNDPIDFWESLENMRIEIKNPQLVGFSGGKENLMDDRAKGHLILNIKADGTRTESTTTLAGGLGYNGNLNQYHSEIIHLEYNALSRGIDRNAIYNVGDIFKGHLTGVLFFENNFFGDGGYRMVLPEPQTALIEWYKTNQLEAPLDLAQRLKRSSKPEPWELSEHHMTISTYNVKNLAGSQNARIKAIGKNISIVLNCPDLIAMVEVQDFNGISFEGGSEASTTLKKIIQASHCAPKVTYEISNIDPRPHQEGGQPGGNIRVSFLINSKRLNYQAQAAQTDDQESLGILKNGRLSHNPGRIATASRAFRGTRKSLVAEFYFGSQRFVIVGNHFNSKLGDQGLFQSQQPPRFKSEVKRIQMASQVNEFLTQLIKIDPSVNVIVLGDFNDHQNSNAMRVLKGTDLVNLLTQDHLVAPKDRYTYNYQGQSQMIDHIFVSHNLLSKQPDVKILHINTDFMGRYSDHDPILVRFTIH